MLDFRLMVLNLLPLEIWRMLEFWVCAAVAAGCLWQLVYDAKFAVGKGWGSTTPRVGLVIQTVFALAGVGDAFKAHEPHVLFICYVTGTAAIQASLYWRWLQAGRPAAI